MSQFYIGTTAGSLPPSVPLQFTADDATVAIPAGNNLNLFTNDSSTNNNNGIHSTASGATVTTLLTNRITGTATTTDGTTPVNVYTFPLGAVAGAYLFQAQVVVYDVTDALSATYSAWANVRTTGAAGSLISSSTGIVSEEGALSALNVGNIVTGNDLVLTVTGLAGKTINYLALTQYIFTS